MVFYWFRQLNKTQTIWFGQGPKADNSSSIGEFPLTEILSGASIYGHSSDVYFQFSKFIDRSCFVIR